MPRGNYPRLFPEPDQTIAGIGRVLREGRTSCVQILEDCLAQIDEWEPRVHAWVVLDRDRAIEQARALDDELKSGKDRGPLHGIPIGVKDIIDVAGLPTACGSKRWAETIAESDANVVANLREAGAVIMGKTVTTPYAWIDPPITRNPWNLERTPGGSSSGSAAAVACGMCYGAIGTQTGGSITRPASFCGVAGMKPSKRGSDECIFDGVKPFAPSLDHVGPIARVVDDLRVLRREFPDTVAQAGGGIAILFDDPPRLGRLRGFFDRQADPAILQTFDEAMGVFGSAGATIVEAKDPVDFENVIREHRRIMATEASVVHAGWLGEFPQDYPSRIRELIEEGLFLREHRDLPAKDRMERLLQGQLMEAIGDLGAQERRARSLVDLLNSCSNLDSYVAAWITPATIGSAPDPSTTGDPSFNSPWSYFGLPTVSFPIGLAPDGMPVAVQLVGSAVGADFELLRVAAWCEQAIRAARQ